MAIMEEEAELSIQQKLQPIKTGAERIGLTPPDSAEHSLPNITFLEENGDDEPMTPAGRMFMEMNPIMVCICVLGFKYPIDRETFKAHLEKTLLKHKRFTSQVEMRKGRRWWTQVRTDVSDHVFEAQLTPEQGEDPDFVMKYLSDVVLPRPFDTSKPLWDVHVLDAKVGGAQGCCVFRIHHALGDGTSLISLLMACTRVVKEPNDLPADMTPAISQSPTKTETNTNTKTSSTSFFSRLLASICSFLLVFWYSLTEIGRALATIVWLKDSRTLMTGYSGLEHSPKTCRFVLLRMDEIKSVSKATGATVNDVFMAMGAFALRRYLEHRAVIDFPSNDPNGVKGTPVNPTAVGENNPVSNRRTLSTKALMRKLDNLRIRAAVMINTRASPGVQELSAMMSGKASQARWGNHMGYMIIPIPMKQSSTDLLELVRRTQVIGNKKKLSYEGLFSYKSGALAMRLLGEKVATALVTRITLQTTLSMSNVKGPSESVMFADNPIAHVIPSATGHPHSLVLHLQSYSGEVALVAMAARKIIPDPEFFLQLCLDGLQEMKTNAAADSNSQKLRLKS